jgi:hypothetical protein
MDWLRERFEERPLQTVVDDIPTQGVIAEDSVRVFRGWTRGAWCKVNVMRLCGEPVGGRAGEGG